MLIANDIKIYSSFILLDKEDIYSYGRIKSNGATTKLRSYHAKQLSNIIEYISFLAASGENILADDPIKWNNKIDFEQWKHLGKPISNKVQSTNTTPATLPADTALTTENQQKTDDDRLKGWRHRAKHPKDCPMLENDEYYTKWRTKMV